MRSFIQVLTLVAGTLAGSAHATPRELVLSMPDGEDCPSRSAVVAALRRIVPYVRVFDDLRMDALVAQVEDLGDDYLVRAGLVRIVPDPVRRCAERARTAAVVLAIGLEVAPPRRSR